MLAATSLHGTSALISRLMGGWTFISHICRLYTLRVSDVVATPSGLRMMTLLLNHLRVNLVPLLDHNLRHAGNSAQGDTILMDTRMLNCSASSDGS